MSDILRQVDEDLRKERLKKIYNKYGIYLIIFFILVTLVTIGYQVNKSINSKYNEDLVEKYLSASTNSNLDEKFNSLIQLSESNHGMVSGLSALKAVNLLFEKGNIEEGRIKLKEIIENTQYDKIIIDLSKYYYLISVIDIVDDSEFELYLTNDVLVQSEFRFLFKELFAIRLLLKGDTDTSKIRFEEIIMDPSTPLEVNLRARKFINLVK